MGPRIIASSFLAILRIDDAWQTPAKGSHEVSSVGQQLVQDQVLGEVAIAARPFSLLGALLMGGRLRSETAPIHRSQPPTESGSPALGKEVRPAGS